MNNFNKPAIILPELNNPKFAEFYGIMIGDGCIYSNLSGICISGHSILDQKYHLEHINNLSKEIFGLKPKIYYSKNQKLIRTVIYSKELANYLLALGFPKGLKKGKILIPEIYLQEKFLIKNWIKGLYDTDGTIYHHKGAKGIIEISIKDKELLKITKIALDKLELDMKISTNRVYLSGKDKIINFFYLIEPLNLKHKIKFDNLINNQKILSSKEIENLLKGEFLEKSCMSQWSSGYLPKEDYR